MHAVILAAGEGSRMGSRTTEVPKAFMEVAGRTLYDRQRTAVDDFVDGVTVVLGYAYENVIDLVDARTVVIEDWADYENAESLRRGIRGIDDDVLVLNGDVIVTDAAVAQVRTCHDGADDHSVVARLPGVQEEHTAVRSDDRDLVVDYGLIPGPQHAGLGILDREHLDRARTWLRDNRCEWYPGLYTTVETVAVTIPASHHIEINYPRDVTKARRKLPLDSTEELDAGA